MNRRRLYSSYDLHLGKNAICTYDSFGELVGTKMTSDHIRGIYVKGVAPLRGKPFLSKTRQGNLRERQTQYVSETRLSEEDIFEFTLGQTHWVEDEYELVVE